MTEFEDHITQLLKEYDAAPWWKRTWWKIMAWLWPIRYCKFSHSIVIKFPVACVWDSMLGSRRLSFGYSYYHRIPVAMRLLLGYKITWTKVWERKSKETTGE